MKLSKEVKVGILTVVAIALFIFGYSYLKGSNLLEDNRVYYAVYDNVEGLTKSAPVTINGLRVGNIDDIKFLDDSGRLIVKFHVNGEFSFSSESTASVYSTSLIGGKALAIVPNFESTAIAAKSGDTLKSKLDKGLQGEVMDQFIPLKDKIEHMVVSADSVLVAVNKTLNPDARAAITSSLEELNKTLVEFKALSRNANTLLADNKESLGRTIKNLDVTTENFAKISDTLAQVEIAGTVKQLEETIGKFNTVLDKVSNGEGSLGKLMTDDKLYTNLERATEQAADLLQDMKLNPKRYVHFSVFGKRPGPYEEPEDPTK
ncbi:MlaD family protein [Nonlabens ulvanivorans]|uniref:Mce4/Rv3499c/MTV023.06c protein n=1 Tax=Nonlabens ulvanivorans TaxID=906888 RepID=A0A081DEH4_NONUL|nr:MlaD family protein [Nonlabens ulvanivorans]WOI23535.1 MlaD family protein [Nonlabens ulvanivorans]GAK77320.1 Mce4/Rv3499c/MTV023.06c protein [Nonlabens ulvanivorans]GAL01490.1 Mce4/Rv3499c/MTV023.06c protein [Nonlabens ulvanivorans]GAL76336.1 Mce4/Rv3499c/MTV023.06c protein [Nonlabens ulvanivorans]